MSCLATSQPDCLSRGILVNYEFSEDIDFQDLNREKTIVVASKDDEMMITSQIRLFMVVMVHTFPHLSPKE